MQAPKRNSTSVPHVVIRCLKRTEVIIWKTEWRKFAAYSTVARAGRAVVVCTNFLLPLCLLHEPFPPFLPTYVLLARVWIRVDRQVLGHSERWRAHAVPSASQTSLVSQARGPHCCPYAGCGKSYQQRTSVVIPYVGSAVEPSLLTTHVSHTHAHTHTHTHTH